MAPDFRVIEGGKLSQQAEIELALEDGGQWGAARRIQLSWLESRNSDLTAAEWMRVLELDLDAVRSHAAYADENQLAAEACQDWIVQLVGSAMAWHSKIEGAKRDGAA
jgi:hypothetical protein